MFRGERYNNQERSNILQGKILARCVAVLGAHPNTIGLINVNVNVLCYDYKDVVSLCLILYHGMNTILCHPNIYP